MAEPVEFDFPLLPLMATAIRRSRWLAAAGLVGAALAILPATLRPRQYQATASFVPQAADGGRSGLASLAGQFGVAVASAAPASSPDFYRDLIKTRRILDPIAAAPFVVTEHGGQSETLAALFDMREAGDTLAERERLVTRLAAAITVTVTRTTSVVRIEVATPWPSVSLQIAQRILQGLNTFNVSVRQTQGSDERRFVEPQRDAARDSLIVAETRLVTFMKANRDIGARTLVGAEYDRLQREVGFRQQIYNTLAQSYEEARIREVRDTPALTTIETPTFPAAPMPRGRATRALLGGGFALVLATLAAILVDRLTQRYAAGDEEVREVMDALRGAVRLRRIAPGSAAP